LKKELAPLNHPQKNIQPNLVTKDGELSQELDRMRVLLARVAARVGEQGNVRMSNGEEQTGSIVMTDQQKLAHVLGLG